MDNSGWEQNAAYNGHHDCVTYLGQQSCVDVISKSFEVESSFLAFKNLIVAEKAVQALLKLKSNVNISMLQLRTHCHEKVFKIVRYLLMCHLFGLVIAGLYFIKMNYTGCPKW